MAFNWKMQRPSGQAPEQVYISLAAGTLTISFGGHTNLSFDGEGRLVGAWYDKRTYRRSLDNRLLVKHSVTNAGERRTRRFLSPAEATTLLNRAYGDAYSLQTGLSEGFGDTGSTRESNLIVVQKWLSTIAQWNRERLAQDARKFHAVYKPISILPPDQYLSLVLQATEGCSYNECSFCTFYRDRRFTIKRPEEFEQHINQVKHFFGRSLFVRQSIFLADANAIVIPQKQLLPLLDTVNRHFTFCASGNAEEPAIQMHPEQWSPCGINAFVSAPDALRKSAEDMRELAELNVRRLYVGMETGHDPLRSFLRKPGTTDDVLRAVSIIKEGGLQVGIIFMVGIGGQQFAQRHYSDTVDAITRMPLGHGDLVYISPFVPSSESPYLDDMQRSGYSSMSADSILEEEERFRSTLLPLMRKRGVRVSRYDIREFIY